jgi:hypothetical protein
MRTTPVAFMTTLSLVLTLAVVSPAAARQEFPGAPAQEGPLTLAPISSSIVISPEAKVTTIDGATALLVGGYAGKLIEEKMLIGAGAYWLADPREDARMFYAGLVLGGRVLGTDRTNLSVRGLVGAGQATIEGPFVLKAGHPQSARGHRAFQQTVRSGIRDGFMLVEPEIRLLVGITDAIDLNLGAGYRATSSLGDFLRGPTGSFGVQIAIGR